MAGKNIECKIIKILKDQKSGSASTQVRIVRWIVDGKDTGAFLEKRSFFDLKDGGQKIGKAKGFNREDMEFIVSSWEEIKNLM